MTSARHFLISIILMLSTLLGVEPMQAAGSGSREVTGRAQSAMPAVNVDSLVREILRDDSRNAAYGLWRATIDAATVAILPAKAWQRRGCSPISGELANVLRDDALVMVVVGSPTPGLQPGMVMGMMTPASKKGVYRARIFTKYKHSDRRFASPRNFVLTLHDDSHLSMRAIHKGIEVDPWRFLPYMFRGIALRGVIKYRDDTPADLDGFVRIFPLTANSQSPIIL